VALTALLGTQGLTKRFGVVSRFEVVGVTTVGVNVSALVFLRAPLGSSLRGSNRGAIDEPELATALRGTIRTVVNEEDFD
jgi:hypothetical protein